MEIGWLLTFMYVDGLGQHCANALELRVLHKAIWLVWSETTQNLDLCTDPCSLRRCRLTGGYIGMPIISLRQLDERLRLIMGIPIPIRCCFYLNNYRPWTRFLSLAQSKLRLCSANNTNRPGYWSNLPCDWPSTAWAYSEQETENGPWCGAIYRLLHKEYEICCIKTLYYNW